MRGPADAAAAGLLAAAYADHCLDLAGPAPPFDPAAAVAAAGRVWSACWFLLHRGDGPDVVERALALPPPENDLEARILALLSTEPTHVDEVGRGAGLPIHAVSSTLTMMELKGMIKQVGGMQYVLAR